MSIDQTSLPYSILPDQHESESNKKSEPKDDSEKSREPVPEESQDKRDERKERKISPQQDLWTKLANLKELQTQGLISNEEFESRKQQLVDTMTGTKIDSSSSKPKTRTRHRTHPKVGFSIPEAIPEKGRSIPRPPPDWHDLPTERAVRHSYDFTNSTWVQANIVVKMDRVPFARGSLRYAYYMQDLSVLDDPAKKEKDSIFVAKVSVDPFEERVSYFQDVAMQIYAKEYAKKYNSYDPPKKVDFIAAYVLELVERPNSPLCGVENFIEGSYRKYNSNFGYVSEDERNTPQAFSHFTYEASQNQILICDVQGVGDLYTDPQIHTVDGNGFGKGNMGDRGFAKFLGTHRCNAVCRYLKLPSINAKLDAGTIPNAQYIDGDISADDVAKFNSSIAFVSDASLYATTLKQQSPILPELPPDHKPPPESQCCSCNIL